MVNFIFIDVISLLSLSYAMTLGLPQKVLTPVNASLLCLVPAHDFWYASPYTNSATDARH